LDADGELQVAARRPGVAGVAEPAEADAVAGVDARGDLDFDRLAADHPAVAAAARARVGDDDPLAAARPARLLDLEKPLPLDHDPLAAAPPAGGRLRPRLGPGPAARLAQVLALDRDRLLHPGGGLGQL